VAKKWQKLGHVLTPIGNPDAPSGWKGIAAAKGVTVRRAKVQKTTVSAEK
jgi:hypothetical protein